MTMESPGVKSNSASGSPVGETPPMMHTLQPMAVTSTSESQISSQQVNAVSGQQFTMTSVHGTSVHPAFVMAQSSSKEQQVVFSGQHAPMMMQPPTSMPLMVSPYHMILPTQGLVDQQGLLQQQTENNSRAATPGSPAIGGGGSRSSTPASVYQQHVLQISDAQVKSDPDAVPSPVRQGSVGSGGSPAPPTPGSLGSPLPQGLQLQAGQIPMNIHVVGTPPPTEEKIDISKLKPPKKPLTPYMRFSKSIWPQVKAVNQTLSVCEIGATIGRMWRELADTEKQRYNEDFANDKIRYDTDLQEYLKITGLQASDLVKKPKKKAVNKDKSKQSQQSPKTQPAQQNTVVQQVQGQQLIGVQPVIQSSTNGPVSIHNSVATTGLPQQVLSGALSGLPHFSQVWTGQQGATIFSQGQGGQEQLYVQQGPNGQQVLINALGVPQGTLVNGSTGTSENVINTPILIQPTGEQTALFRQQQQQNTNNQVKPQQYVSTEEQGEKDGQQAEGTHISQATMAQLAALGWQQVIGNPSDLQQQQHMINLINMATAQGGVQPDQLTQAAQIAGLQPPGMLGLQQVSIGTPAADSNTESQQVETPGLTQVLSTSEASQNGAITQTIQNGPQPATTQAVVTLGQVPTAHSLYNSYGFNPWSAFPGQVVQTAEVAQEGTAATTTTTDGQQALGGIQVVYNRENILEIELQHLRSALSEKTKEVQRLSQELEKAYNIIEQLKQQNPTAVIQLPAPQPEVPQAGSPATSTPAT